jgi:hypothetical protein
MKVMAYVHSLKQKGDPYNGDFGHQMAEVTIISHKNNNDVTAEYNGVLCTAIFNPFTGAYYVDDIYGRISNI